MALTDNFGRKFTYLRIGVTDRCNLRCRYCMPAEGIDFLHRKDLLDYKEIIRLAKLFNQLGIEKTRITGGEPFVRKDMGILLEQLSDIFPSLHITTNATYLEKHIPLLKRININGLNISLDTLSREKFHLITRRDKFDVVWSNILNTIEAGINVKINVVVMKGINDHEIYDFIDFSQKYNVEVRFIEAMPFNETDGNKSLFLSANEMLSFIKEKYPNIQKIEDNDNSSSLKYSIAQDTKIGIIPAYTRSLCGSCNRLRLTPKGELLSCLYAKKGVDLLKLMRQSEYTDRQLAEIIKHVVFHKKENGLIEEQLRSDNIFNSMTTIGG